VIRSTKFLAAAALALAVTAVIAVTAADAQRERKTPYWASISSGKAMMRTGPGRNYPATWLYLRRDLPVQVIETYPSWRKVRDPGGETGWMLQTLLSDQRTALVTGGEPRPMHEAAKADSPIRFHAEPGVVGRISRCGDGWCRFDVGGREGYIRSDHIWGLDPGERVD
jgi:SH3-like domain-containing protein